MTTEKARSAIGPRQITLHAFHMATLGHQTSGVWAHPDDQSDRYADIKYWIELAQILERGGFDTLFLADVLGIYDVYNGSRDAAVRQAAQVPVNDPTYSIPAMAAVTERLGFAVTVAVTYEQPYKFARMMSTLDHLTSGRVAWNIVTSYLQSAALNLGLKTQIEHDERYNIADEFCDVCYKLWEGSWEDDAVVNDRERRIYADPAKVHDIEHEGKYYSVPGAFLCEPSPQRTPYLVQAGASPRGRAFASRHSEAIFVTSTKPEALRPIVDDYRNHVAEQGRDPQSIKFLHLIAPIVAPTRTEAEAKMEDLQKYRSVEGALALYGGWTGIDLATLPEDQPLEAVDNDAVRTVGRMFSDINDSVTWTPKLVGEWLTIGGLGPVVCGSPTDVADELERWVDIADVDGFNIAFVTRPGTFKDFGDLVVPELRRRGLVPTEHARGLTLRERMGGPGPLLSPDHPGAQYRRPAAHARAKKPGTAIRSG